MSIILPTFNRANYIIDAVNSVFDQDFKDFELIVIDDGSKDNTLDLLGQINDPRLKVFPRENNGRSAARNFGIKKSLGRYIAFLDSDDLYLPDKLSYQVAYMESHKHVAMTYSSALCVDEMNEQVIGKFNVGRSEQVYKNIAFFRPITVALPTVMLRKDILEFTGLFDSELDRFEDTDMWRRVSRDFTVHALRRDTCRIRTHPSNTLLSQDPNEIRRNLDYYIKKILKEDNVLSPSQRDKLISNVYLYYAKAFYSVPEWRYDAKQLLKKANRYFKLSTFIFAVYVFKSRLRTAFSMKKKSNMR